MSLKPAMPIVRRALYLCVAPLVFSATASFAQDASGDVDRVIEGGPELGSPAVRVSRP
jgi:hypothetical protein